MPSQVYILIAAAAVMFCVIGGLSLLAHYYTLNGIKSRTVGDGQHGTARFASKQEIKNTYQHIPFQSELWRQGQCLPAKTEQGGILGSIGAKNNVTALVDTDDVHCLMVGASGVGKTAFFLYPNLEYACASGMSFLTTDTKGDLYRNYGTIARDHYGYHVAVIDLRNPTRSDGNNMLHLVNTYMDQYLVDENNLVAKAKAEKYAKLISKTIINASSENYGQNQFFYDAAEGLLASVILLIAEYMPPTEIDGKKVDCRHIISVFKLVQDLLAPSKVKGKSQFQLLMDKLPSDHKARWFAGAALNSAEQAMASVLSTVLSRLNAFLDSEMEQILCFDTALDAEKFCKEKSALFVVLPEEDTTKYFMVSLLIQQLYREILSVADEMGGKLKNRVVFFMDEIGTIPPIQSLELMFSASRSRSLLLVPVVQSISGQLVKNYGKEGSEIIIDNCQDVIFGGFAPNSQTAEVLSKALGIRTVMSGSVSRGKNDPSQSLQMMERPLMTPDELKSIPKGNFVVMKTGTHPMRTKLRLFLDWGIRFGEPYTVEEKAHRKVVYADKQTLEENIVRKHMACMMVDEETGEILEPTTGTGTLHTPVAEPSENTVRRRSILKT
jgi:type IV secretion system protein VirD4